MEGVAAPLLSPASVNSSSAPQYLFGFFAVLDAYRHPRQTRAHRARNMLKTRAICWRGWYGDAWRGGCGMAIRQARRGGRRAA
jgi:hypothetical protein